jgi:hypothetical protein
LALKGAASGAAINSADALMNKKRFKRLQKKMIHSSTVCKAYPWPNNIQIGLLRATSTASHCAEVMSKTSQQGGAAR